MSNPSRFRLYRGRVDGDDLANVHTVGKVLTSDGIQVDLSTTAGGLILDTLSLDNSKASHVFIGGRFPNAAWKMWRWDESQSDGEEVSEGSGADITTVAQSAAASDQAIMTMDQNDGWVVAADRKFSTLILQIEDVATLDVLTDEFSYWNGSSWTALSAGDILCAKGATGTVPAAQGTNLTLNDGNVPVAGADLWGNKEDTLLVFSMPLDWQKTTTSTTVHNTAQGGVDSGYYALRWRNTGDPTAGNVGTLDRAYIGTATRLVVWSLSDITTGESLGLPITSSDELPWVVYEMAGTHKVAASVQVSGFNDKLGEGSKG
tara:strand:- start:4901 stop:5854 length:954 start_codon:yes stop_codon:yes gene_type:complete